MLKQPKPITLTDGDGVEKTYIMHKLSALDGREMVLKYPISNVPKLGEYATSEEMAMKLLANVGVEIAGGNMIMLQTRDLINNHCTDFEILLRLELSMLQYNVSFFRNGLHSTFFADIRAKAPKWITPILTALQEQLSATEKPPSTS